MNLAMNLEASAYFFPDRAAVRQAGSETSYARLTAQANTIATGLLKMGVKAGEPVSFQEYWTGESVSWAFCMIVRAYTYITMLGAEGLRRVAEHAVLNANYLLARLRSTYHVPYDRICMHEFVMEGRWDDAPEVHALDISKRLMDYNFHPPTNYFPLIVHEALND